MRGWMRLLPDNEYAVASAQSASPEARPPKQPATKNEESDDHGKEVFDQVACCVSVDWFICQPYDHAQTFGGATLRGIVMDLSKAVATDAVVIVRNERQVTKELSKQTLMDSIISRR